MATNTTVPSELVCFARSTVPYAPSAVKPSEFLSRLLGAGGCALGGSPVQGTCVHMCTPCCSVHAATETDSTILLHGFTAQR